MSHKTKTPLLNAGGCVWDPAFQPALGWGGKPFSPGAWFSPYSSLPVESRRSEVLLQGLSISWVSYHPFPFASYPCFALAHSQREGGQMVTALGHQATCCKGVHLKPGREEALSEIFSRVLSGMLEKLDLTPQHSPSVRFYIFPFAFAVPFLASSKRYVNQPNCSAHLTVSSHAACSLWLSLPPSPKPSNLNSPLVHQVVFF